MINLMQGFNIGSAVAVDSRLLKSKAEMVAVNDNVMPDKYMAICTEDGLLYLYDKAAVPNDLTGKFRKAVPEKTSDLINEGEPSFATNKRVDEEVATLERHDQASDTVKVDFSYEGNKIIFQFKNATGEMLYSNSFELVAGDNIDISQSGDRFTISATYTGDAETGVSIENGQIKVNTFADKVSYNDTTVKAAIDTISGTLNTHLDKSGFKHGVSEIEESSDKQFMTANQRNQLDKAYDHEEKDLLIEKVELIDPSEKKLAWMEVGDPETGSTKFEVNPEYAAGSDGGMTSFKIVEGSDGKKTLQLDLSGKVSKDGAKGLSTYDFNQTYKDLLEKGVPHLRADSHGNMKIPTSYLPESETSTLVVFDDYNSFPVANSEEFTFNDSVIYIDGATQDAYRWLRVDPGTLTGTDDEKRAQLYIEISQQITLGRGQNDAFRGSDGAAIDDWLDRSATNAGTLTQYVSSVANGIKDKIGNLPADYSKTVVEYIDEHDQALDNKISTLQTTVSDNKSSIESSLAALDKTVSDNKTAADASLSELSTKADANASNISALSNKVGTLPKGQSTVVSYIDTVNNKVNLPEGQSTVTSYVQSVQTSLSSQITNGIDSLSNKVGISKLPAEYNSKTVVEYIKDKDSALDSKITALSNKVGNLPGGQSSVVGYIGAVNDKVGDLPSDLPETVKTVTGYVEHALAANSTADQNYTDNKIGAIAGKTVKAYVDDSDTKLRSDISSKIGDLPSGHSTVVGYVQSVQSNLTGSINGLSSKIGTLPGEQSSVVGYIGAVNSTVSTIASKTAPGFRNGFVKLLQSGWTAVEEPAAPPEKPSSNVLYYSQSALVFPSYDETAGYGTGEAYVFGASACPILDVSVPLVSASDSDAILLDWSQIFRADTADPAVESPAGRIIFYAKSVPSRDLVVKVANI